LTLKQDGAGQMRNWGKVTVDVVEMFKEKRRELGEDRVLCKVYHQLGGCGEYEEYRKSGVSGLKKLSLQQKHRNNLNKRKREPWWGGTQSKGSIRAVG